MRVRATTDAPRDTGADTVAIGLFEGEGIAHDLEGAPLQRLVDSGEARADFKRLALLHADGLRWLLVGLGDRGAFDAERARVAAAVALGRAGEVGARVLCWELPHKVGDDVAEAFVEGTVLAGYRYDAWKSKPGDGSSATGAGGAGDGGPASADAAAPGPAGAAGPPAEDPADDDGRLEELVVSAHHDVSAAVEVARVSAEAANATRDLQNAPGNEMTPTRLAERARRIADELGLACEVLGREQIRYAGMGAFAAVAQGSDEEPQLITLRYSPEDARGPVVGLVGKAVTFDSGGISLKPGLGMSGMKFDMSGGAAVLEATAAIARLRLPVQVIAVVGATENLPSGRAVKPGDIVRARSGTTIEIINTDAEGRLVLADCLTHAREQGAERLVDVATLTGAIVTTLGATYAGLFGNGDEWVETVRAAGERAGEPLWRLPLHREYADAIKGRYADIANAVEDRKAGSIVAAEFLRRFTADVPWAHLDIAGVGWDRGRPYAPKGGSGFATRTLIALARGIAAGAAG